ncbi:MAG: DUF2070 family protein [Candidatus Thermoplasmatota archaeon]|nr:DUF2070 family protein [Candidatus Thermoplasmatota archaeon]
MENTVLVSERGSRSLLYRLPSLKIQLPVIAILSLFYAFIFPLHEISRYLVIFSIVFVPSILSVFILPYLRSYKVRMNFRQSGSIALISLLSSLMLYWVLIYLGLSFEGSFIISMAFPASFRFLGITGAFQHDPKRSLLPSLIQSLLPLPLFQIFFNLNILYLLGFLITLMIGLSFMLALIPCINRRFKKDFGVSTLEVLNIIIKTIHGEEEGKRELEEFFANNSVVGDVEYTIYSFRTEEDKRHKALFVIPGLHPGPLRGLGGSRLSNILSEKLKDENVFTFHAPSTHTVNPVREKDCKKLSESIEKDLQFLNYSDKASRFVRIDEEGIVGAQRFGDNVFTNLSFYPEPAEDVHASVGKIISQIGEKHDFPEVGVVDSHNSGERRVSSVFYPTRRTKRIIRTAGKIFNEINEEETENFKMGISSKVGYEETGIAGEGIKVAVFEVDEQRSAQILVDANNMNKGLRGKIQGAIEDLVDISEIHTTDTHEVNTLLHSHQPLGSKISSKRLIKDIRELLEDAIKDLEPVEVAVKTNTLDGMELMGPINTGRMNAVSETIFSTVPYALILTFTFQFVLTLFIFAMVW